MIVLVVGSGGREHALCWAIAKSPLCDKLYCAPGNAGIAGIAECVPVGAEDIAGIVRFAKDSNVDFAVVGPEMPLVAGLVDALEKAGIKAFGPSAAAARIEGSKGFMKDLCARYDIPTAAYGRFDEPDQAKEFILRQDTRVVVKADGLAAGKGVIVCHNENEAYAAIDHIMIESAFGEAGADGLAAGKGVIVCHNENEAYAAIDHIMIESAFGEAGAEVVIEEFLEGEEASFFALVDGERVLPLASAQDHKRAHDGDEGPNTGGMGSYSPAPVVTEDLTKKIMERIIDPTVAAMRAEGHPYKGLLYAGLMIKDGEPKVLEFNARFGDPECQPLLMRLKSDLLPALVACADEKIDSIDLEWYDDAALLVVMAAQGYPGYYPKGSEIRGIEDADALDGVVVFHAGTKSDDGRIIADGGRVLGVTARASTVAEAQKLAYDAVDRIDWPEGFCRRDIGWRAIDR